MFSIKTKLLISYTLVFGSLIIGYSVYIHQRIRSAAIETLDTRLKNFAERFESELEELIQHRQTITTGAVTEARKEAQEKFLIRLVDTTGTIIFSDTILSNSIFDFHEYLDGKNAASDIIHLGKEEFRTMWIPLELNDRIGAVLQVAAPMTEIEAGLQQLRWIFFITIPFAFILSAVAAYGITLIGFRPMSVMIESARTITENNLDQRLPIPESTDEVSLLGVTFNNMIGRIAAAFQSQRQFITDASHEFRTPLTIIQSELEYAVRRHSPKEIKESIRISLDEVAHLKRLTDDLLLMAKLDSRQIQLNKKPFRLDECVVGCIRKVTQVAMLKGISFRVDIEAGIEYCGDEEKIESIVINLLDNAVKYSKQNSAINVDLNGHQNAIITLTVTNTGIGIPAEEISSLFNRFYRGSSSRSEHSGSGLGLAIAKQLAEMHQGTISVSSIPNKKTTFKVEFPFTPK